MTSGRGSPLFHQEETEKHKEILRGPAIFSRLRRRGGGVWNSGEDHLVFEKEPRGDHSSPIEYKGRTIQNVLPINCP